MGYGKKPSASERWRRRRRRRKQRRRRRRRKQRRRRRRRKQSMAGPSHGSRGIVSKVRQECQQHPWEFRAYGLSLPESVPDTESSGRLSPYVLSP